jgi:hypothetical protein
MPRHAPVTSQPAPPTPENVLTPEPEGLEAVRAVETKIRALLRRANSFRKKVAELDGERAALEAKRVKLTQEYLDSLGGTRPVPDPETEGILRP